MSDIKEVSAWAVVDYEGSIVLWTTTETERNAKLNFEVANGFDWEKAQQLGYSCIEVTIKPKEKI